MAASKPPQRHRPRRRQMLRVLAMAALPALLMHGIVLGGLPVAAQGPVATENLLPLRVRAIVAQPADPGPTTASIPARPLIGTAPSAAATPRAREPVTEVASSGAVKNEAAEALPPPPTNAAVEDENAEPQHPIEPVDASLATDEPAQWLVAANAEMQRVADRGPTREAAEGDAIPTYPTSFPPSQTLRYDLQRGLLSGTAELNWRREPPERAGAGYELQLQARLGGLTIMTQVSKGGFDKAGLAPLRFTDQRLRGSVRAANFQRQNGLITFSGPSVEYPLVRGVQDRLSWMIQVPAILAANPRLAAPGQRITMYVVGSRGDATTWDFRFDDRERVATDGGEVIAVKFSRQPRKQHDTLAEVWLDPARHYLPLRARIGNPEDGAMLELRRID